MSDDEDLRKELKSIISNSKGKGGIEKHVKDNKIAQLNVKGKSSVNEKKIKANTVTSNQSKPKDSKIILKSKSKEASIKPQPVNNKSKDSNKPQIVSSNKKQVVTKKLSKQVNGNNEGNNKKVEPSTKKDNEGTVNSHGKSLLPSSISSKLIRSSGEGSWWEAVEPLEITNLESNPPAHLIESMKKNAVSILEHVEKEHSNNKGKYEDKDNKWMDTVISKGTLSDKVGALTLSVQQSPLHNLSKLEALVNMTIKSGKRESEMSMEPVKDLFISTLLPDRKLRDFKKQSWLGNSSVTANHLLVAEFESRLKGLYLKFVQAIEESTTKGLPHVKRLSMNTAFDLLSSKPEQEEFLLGILVNKLGDPERKVAAKAAFLLSQLVTMHPAMKLIIVKEVEQLVFRPNIADKAQYYAVIFLNQILINKGNVDLARRLLHVYFSLFERCTQQDNIVTTRLLSGLLSGVNRAYPFSEMNLADISKQIDSLFKIVHIGTFSTGVQSLTLLFQVSDGNVELRDRFYRALYALLLNNQLQTASKHTIFFNLVYRSLKVDKDEGRVIAILKRLLQVCFHMEAPFICGSLYLISQLLNDRPMLKFIIKSSESGRDEKTKEKPYDAAAREPRAANAQVSCMWELSVFAAHAHPSVRKFSETIITDESGGIQYKGDPLNDFTLISFLDRFAFRNPKKKDLEKTNAKGDKGSSNFQPKGFGKRGMNAIKAPVNSKEFADMDEKNVPVEEKFYYQYFKQQEERGGKKKKKKDGDEEEEDAFEDEDDFANHLAEEMIKKHDGDNLDSEDVDFDWSEDEEETTNEGNGFEDDVEGDHLDGGELNEEFDDEEEDGKLNENDGSSSNDGDEGIMLEGESDDDDDWGFEDEEEDEEEEDEFSTFNKKHGKKSSQASVFADADEFAEILESAGTNDRIPAKQQKWESKQDWSGNKNNNKRKMNFSNNKPNKRRK